MSRLTDELSKTLNIINESQRFAEAKNAVLIGLNGTAIFGYTEANPLINEEGMVDYFALWFISLLTISTCRSIISFFPKLTAVKQKKPNDSSKLQKIPLLGRAVKRKKEKDALNSKNILFFGHIVNFEEGEYLETYAHSLNIKSDSIEEIDKFYVNQIIINSRIALRKYQAFSWAIRFGALGLLSLVVEFVAILKEILN